MTQGMLVVHFFKKETNMREHNNLAVSMFSFRCPFCVGIHFPDAG